MTELNDQFWESKYRNADTGWDIGYISTPLKNYIDRLADLTIPILIPGCGNAYEADYLLEKGATNVVLVDFALQPIELAKKRFLHYGKRIQILQEDFFDHKGEYALILEQTFFCAIDPVLRKKYVEKMHELLAPTGKLARILFNREFESSPPYGGNELEYRKTFGKRFDNIIMYPESNSIPPRAGNELFFEVTKTN